MNFEIREPRTPHEAEQSRWLAQEAFGMPAEPPSEPATLRSPGCVTWAAFDGERMAARMDDNAYDTWFGGALVPTSGIGGVTVSMEYRRRGLLRPLFDQLFAGARARGAVISTLFPSATGIYRRLGYEVIGTAEQATLPLTALARVRRPDEVVTRRAGVGDVPAIRAIYDRWAAAQNGPLSRRGVSFPATDQELVSGRTQFTVAERDGTMIGYASWVRGRDWGPTAVLQVDDLLADSVAGYRALLSDFASFAGLLGSMTIRTSGLDLVRHVLPSSDWHPDQNDAYMLKILDVCGALAARGYSSAVSATLEFGVVGDPITGTDGAYRAEIADGRASCVRTGDASEVAGLPIFTPNGLAVAFAGAQSAAGIRSVGGLTGPDSDDDTWGAVFAGRPVRVRDHF